jgi:hypothetical protein
LPFALLPLLVPHPPLFPCPLLHAGLPLLAFVLAGLMGASSVHVHFYLLIITWSIHCNIRPQVKTEFSSLSSCPSYELEILGVRDLNSGYTVRCLQSRACTLAHTVSPLIAELIYRGWIALSGVGDLNWYRFIQHGLPVWGLSP